MKHISEIKNIKIVISWISIILFSNALAASVTGVGATFPVPIYIEWADAYQKETGKQINYQGIGSSGGVKQIIANTVDFGASDIPLSEDKLNRNKLFQFPTVIGGIVIVINVPDIKFGEMILDGKTLGDIYLGKITKWNDAAIKKFNPKLKLPEKNIAVIHRADSSGTSFVFTKYLTKTNKEWEKKVFFGSTVNWPVGFGGKGNDGVSAFLQRLSGSIGYIEYSYAKINNLSYIKLISDTGKVVSPTIESFTNAAKKLHWNEFLMQKDTVDKTDESIWPIISTTFILLKKHPKISDKNIEILKFFAWAYKNGNTQANNLGYISLPENLIEQIYILWKMNLKDTNYRDIF